MFSNVHFLSDFLFHVLALEMLARIVFFNRTVFKPDVESYRQKALAALKLHSA